MVEKTTDMVCMGLLGNYPLLAVVFALVCAWLGFHLLFDEDDPKKLKDLSDSQEECHVP